ncbi:MAG: ATP-binding protein [Bacteroidota bacterium]
MQRLHTSKQFEGNGIGLASAKRLVELHGGDIWAQSTENVGSTFYFSLPKA